LIQSVLPQLTFSFYRHQPVRADFSGGQITSDAGLLPLRAFDERHHLTRDLAVARASAGWQHEFLLEEVLTGDESFQQLCVRGKRCCPPEDCGGPQGFAELLQVLQDADHPSHDEAREWLAMLP
jgi:Plasmid pRiA4b ORF-3-like protein